MRPMNPAAAGGVPYRVPPEPSRWSAITLAALVHAGLLLFLYVGISWQNTAPVAVEAEVWDMKTQSAAPPPPPPVATPEPTPPPPLPKVEEPPVEKPVAPKPPDIALEREKQRRLEKQKQLEEEHAERERERREDEAAQKLAEKKAAAEKLKADKLAKAKQDAEDKKKLDKLRDAEMKRILAGTGATGEAAKATAPRIDTGYLAQITSKIKSNTSYLGDLDVAGNPKAVFKVDELPTGEIISVKKLKSSGIPAFDDAVEKGIIKSSPLPKKKDGTVERSLEIGFSMKDLN
jgi:colicin import membrane protein